MRSYNYKEFQVNAFTPENEYRKVLFLNTMCNFEGGNPIAYLVQIHKKVTTEILKILESTQRGVGRRDGNWKEIMEDGKIEYILLSVGKKSDYTESDYDEIYQVISGNY